MFAIFNKTVIYFCVITFIIIFTDQVSAHVNNISLITSMPLSFNKGFLHPFSGIDHFLGMLAVGIWATQNKRSAFLVLPLIFPLMMTIGTILALYIQFESWIEFSIALSIFILGLFITFSVKLPISVSASVISLFALCHGYSHGRVLTHDISLIKYGIGFLIATMILHLVGIFVGLCITKLTFKQFLRYVGVSIMALGAYLISNT